MKALLASFDLACKISKIVLFLFYFRFLFSSKIEYILILILLVVKNNIKIYNKEI